MSQESRQNQEVPQLPMEDVNLLSKAVTHSLEKLQATRRPRGLESFIAPPELSAVLLNKYTWGQQWGVLSGKHPRRLVGGIRVTPAA